MRNNLLFAEVIKTAVRQGWFVAVTKSEENSYFFDFQRKTPGGLPFCLTAELTGGLVGSLVDEIISFVDELDPVRYAEEWSDKSGQISVTRFLQAVSDMDDIRTRAWLLAVDLSDLAERQDLILNIPWYSWN